jgi:hypothetical protein
MGWRYRRVGDLDAVFSANPLELLDGVRSASGYLATAAKHGLGFLHVLIGLAQGDPLATHHRIT